MFDVTETRVRERERRELSVKKEKRLHRIREYGFRVSFQLSRTLRCCFLLLLMMLCCV